MTRKAILITKEDCKPLSDHIEGKLVVIKAEEFDVRFRDAKYQLVLACGGFGCDASKLGNAVYVKECTTDNPESYRRERWQLLGEPTEECIAEWKSIYGEFNETVLKEMERYANGI